MHYNVLRNVIYKNERKLEFRCCQKSFEETTPFIITHHIFGVLENALQSREFTEVAEIAERVKK